MKRDDLKEFFRKAYQGNLLEQESGLLLEQDDPFAEEGGEEEGGEEEGGDEEGGDDPFAEEGGDEGGDEEGGDEEGGDEEEDEGPKAEEEDQVRFEKSLDDQLQAIFIDIESDSIKSAQVQEGSYSLAQVLLREQDEGVSIDVDRFAAETARLILNFDAFFDIEEMIMSKARSFLLDKYGEEVADEVEELLSTRHDIARKEDVVAKHEEYDEQVPIAVGATSGGGP
jgi:hypothetical protein